MIFRLEFLVAQGLCASRFTVIHCQPSYTLSLHASTNHSTLASGESTAGLLFELAHGELRPIPGLTRPLADLVQAGLSAEGNLCLIYKIQVRRYTLFGEELPDVL